MRLRSWILPALLVAPLFISNTDAFSCFRFKKPMGAVPPGLREPKDPPPPPPSTPPAPVTPKDPPPSDPKAPPSTTPTTPPTGAPPPPVTTQGGPTASPVTGGPDEGKKKVAAADDTTWETWWMLNRIEFFPHRYVRKITTNQTDSNLVEAVRPLSADVVRAKLWKPLMALKDDKQVFVREASLITIGRVASDDALKSEARKVLLEAIKDPNHLVARAAALGLYYVADSSSMYPMVQVASDPKVDTDVRSFLALTLTAIKSDMAGPLLSKMITAEKDADYELVAAAILGTGFVDGPESARLLKEIYDSKKFRPEHRALAIQSFGRRGSFADGWEILVKALDDKEIVIRRSAAMALGVLEYRTPAQIEIAAIGAKYDTSNGAALPKDELAKIEELKAQIPAQREVNLKHVREVVKALVHSLQNDGDTFVSSMAAISLGRIAGQADESYAMRMLAADLKKERNNVREYELLALAIAKAPEAFDAAVEAIGLGKDGNDKAKNRMPTTRCAGLIALGILGDGRGRDICRHVVEDEGHPIIRGYGAMALGMLGEVDGNSKSYMGSVLSLLKTTKSPEAMASGALGLALFGRGTGSEILVKRLSETSDAEVVSYNVYSLGLMKDRSKIDALVDTAVNHSSFFVQSAAVAALGYVSSAEDYPRRHLMARGYDYTMNLEKLEMYFYKL